MQAHSVTFITIYLFVEFLTALVQRDKKNEYVSVIKGKDNDNRIVIHGNTKITVPSSK